MSILDSFKKIAGEIKDKFTSTLQGKRESTAEKPDAVSFKLDTARAKYPGSQEDDFKLVNDDFVFSPDVTTTVETKIAQKNTIQKLISGVMPVISPVHATQKITEKVVDVSKKVKSEMDKGVTVGEIVNNVAKSAQIGVQVFGQQSSQSLAGLTKALAETDAIKFTPIGMLAPAPVHQSKLEQDIRKGMIKVADKVGKANEKNIIKFYEETPYKYITSVITGGLSMIEAMGLTIATGSAGAAGIAFGLQETPTVL